MFDEEMRKYADTLTQVLHREGEGINPPVEGLVFKAFLTVAAAARHKAIEEIESQPIDLILHCPQCGEQHVDAPEPEKDWTNPPHKSHLCHNCGTVWRAADVPTNGVASILTRGERDTWPTIDAPEVAEVALLPSADRKCACVACLRERDERIGGRPVEQVKMIVCRKCGNKRCPHANDHRHECTNSNATGQRGSAYP